jgi:hypothetical protein
VTLPRRRLRARVDGSPSWPITSESLVIRPQSVSSADNLQTSRVGGSHPRLPWECCPRGPDEVSSLHLERFLNECKPGCPHQPRIIVEDDLDWYFLLWSLHAALAEKGWCPIPPAVLFCWRGGDFRLSYVRSGLVYSSFNELVSGSRIQKDPPGQNPRASGGSCP